jgi:hypothetical protein
MALTVYKVDDTRIILPDSAWGKAALEELAKMGKHIEGTDEDPTAVHESRSQEESARAIALLDSTGL